MQTLSPRALFLGTLAAAVAAAVSLAACNQPGEPTVGQHVDAAIGEAKQASQEVQQAGAQAADAIKAGAIDVTTTTQVHAALAADDRLSMLKIGVDTVGGRVTLTGTAPDAQARVRAATLASAVDGVSSVDNRLTIGGS